MALFFHAGLLVHSNCTLHLANSHPVSQLTAQLPIPRPKPSQKVANLNKVSLNLKPMKQPHQELQKHFPTSRTNNTLADILKYKENVR